MSIFSQNYPLLRLKEATTNTKGLRQNQLGAIGSVLAHFSLREEPALVSMPTGTGKTAVMITLAYALRASKVLVITPSQLVRKQIAKQFEYPKDLIENEILPEDALLPRVYELKGKVNSPDDWKEIIATHDVIVGIPNTLNQIPDLSACLPPDQFELILVDEAHHSRAASWQNLLKHFASVKCVLVTATPFRNDNKDIKARLVYNFPLRLAFNRGLFSKIEYISVNTKSIPDPHEQDVAIAKQTREVFQAHKGYEHKIIIRTDRKKRAVDLKKIYDANTDLKLEVISGDLANSTIDKRIGMLERGELDGVICVDMMGEGFDFPSLKIAAIHAPHKSLAITLQFVGRISRPNAPGPKVARIVAGTHELEIESEKLFKENKDWTEILPDLHAVRTDRAEISQDFFDTLTEITKPESPYVTEVDEPIYIDDADLRPFFHAKIYKVSARDVEPDEDGVLPDLVDMHIMPDFEALACMSKVILRHHHVSNEYHAAVFVLSELIKPKWYALDDDLKDVVNTLLLIYYDQEHSLLFVCSTLKDNELYKAVSAAYINFDAAFLEQISMPQMKRVLAGWKEPKFYNIGMRSRKTRGSSESYRQSMGSVAQKNLSKTDALNYTRGHSFGEGFDSVLGKSMLLGISTGSKVWSIVDGKINELIGWLNNLGRKIVDPEMDKLKSPLEELDCGRDVEEFPVSSNNGILLADWDGKLYDKDTRIAFFQEDDQDGNFELLISCSLIVHQAECNKDKITFSVVKDARSVKIEFSIIPNVQYTYAPDTTHKVRLMNGNIPNKKRSFLHLLEDFPINFFFEDISKLIGRTLFEFDWDKAIKLLPVESFESVDWIAENVNISKEFYTQEDLTANASSGETRPSIHDYIVDKAKQEYSSVYYDHASLEVADVLAFKSQSIRFYHCKKQKGDTPGCTIDEIYEVCGQAVKSAIWTNRKILIDKLIKRNNNGDTGGRVRQGSLTEIQELLLEYDTPTLPVEIVIVHPGLKTKNFVANQAQAFERIRLLLSGAAAYLESIGSSKLLVLAS